MRRAVLAQCCHQIGPHLEHTGLGFIEAEIIEHAASRRRDMTRSVFIVIAIFFSSLTSSDRLPTFRIKAALHEIQVEAGIPSRFMIRRSPRAAGTPANAIYGVTRACVTRS